MRRLQDGPGRVALLAAPAGYGKTALLAQWEAADERPFAWVDLEPAHDGGRVLVEALASAVDAVAPAGDVAELVGSLPDHAPFVLVLDGLHVLRSEGAAAVIRALVRGVPEGARLAIATRTAPPLPVGRLRAERAITEIRSSDLVMTATETHALLSWADAHVTPAEAGELGRAAEGWAAGLALAAAALREDVEPSGVVERFGGDDAIVAEYLRDEVLAPLPAGERAFLLRTSVLERLSAPLCDAVLDEDGAGRMLAALGHDRLLLVPLDRAAQEYRCPRLLAQMLRAELARTEPAEALAVHGRARDWFAARGESDRTLHHAVRAGDTARAAELLGARAPATVTREADEALRRRLGRFTAEEIAGHPPLALAAANQHLLAGELDPVRGWASALRRTLDETPAGQRTPGLEGGVALLDAMAAGDGVVRMARDARLAYEREPEDSPWRPLCCLLEGVAHHLAGDRAAAELRLMEGVRRGAVAAPNVQTLCLAQLALGAFEREDWPTAAGLIVRARGQVEHYALDHSPMSALVLAASAAVRARRGRVEEAQEDARRAHALLDGLTDYMPWFAAEAHVALAAAALRLSDSAASRDSLAAAGRLARWLPDAPVLLQWIAEGERRVERAASRSAALTTAELRILAYLPTHLSFREIGVRLHVSANTVKTQAHAVYRKLDAGSRSHAVTRAGQLGLLDL